MQVLKPKTETQDSLSFQS